MKFTEVELFLNHDIRSGLADFTPAEKIRFWGTLSDDQIVEIINRKYNRVDIYLNPLQFYDYRLRKTVNHLDLRSIHRTGQVRLAWSILEILPSVTNPMDREYLQDIYNRIQKSQWNLLNMSAIFGI